MTAVRLADEPELTSTRVAAANVRRELPLEEVAVRAEGQPEVQTRVDHVDELLGAVGAPGVHDAALARDELGPTVRECVVVAYLREDLLLEHVGLRRGGLRPARDIGRGPPLPPQPLECFVERHRLRVEQRLQPLRAQASVERARRGLAELRRRRGLDQLRVERERAGHHACEVRPGQAVGADDIHRAAGVRLHEQQAHRREVVHERRRRHLVGGRAEHLPVSEPLPDVHREVRRRRVPAVDGRGADDQIVVQGRGDRLLGGHLRLAVDADRRRLVILRVRSRSPVEHVVGRVEDEPRAHCLRSRGDRGGASFVDGSRGVGVLFGAIDAREAAREEDDLRPILLEQRGDGPCVGEIEPSEAARRPGEVRAQCLGTLLLEQAKQRRPHESRGADHERSAPG